MQPPLWFGHVGIDPERSQGSGDVVYMPKMSVSMCVSKLDTP